MLNRSCESRGLWERSKHLYICCLLLCTANDPIDLCCLKVKRSHSEGVLARLFREPAHHDHHRNPAQFTSSVLSPKSSYYAEDHHTITLSCSVANIANIIHATKQSMRYIGLAMKQDRIIVSRLVCPRLKVAFTLMSNVSKSATRHSIKSFVLRAVMFLLGKNKRRKFFQCPTIVNANQSAYKPKWY